MTSTARTLLGVAVPIALFIMLLVSFLEAFVLMLVVGGVWHETGWLAPISYAGALVTTWLLYVLKLIWGVKPDVKTNSS